MFSARLKSVPQDFCVTEELGWECSGDGEHDYLWIEKTSANTAWVAKGLAEFAGVPAKDVGYAGMKDRHAVTRQWFSVPRWHSPDWERLDIEGLQLLDVQRHLRKLRRGAHRTNRFRIVLRVEGELDPVALNERLEKIRKGGVPNYFGEQRFGRDGDNLRLANNWSDGRRLPRHKRGIAISTVRSFVFNQALARRVNEANWNRFVAGDLANLDGSGSVFEVSEIDDELRHRCDVMDLHPAVVLAGEGSGVEPARWQAALDRSRVEAGVRSLRLPVHELENEVASEGLILSFTLGRGSFATSVLREICDPSQT